MIEVGMGGRYDATNVILSPVVCGVAMLDLDHTQARVLSNSYTLFSIPISVIADPPRLELLT